MEEEEEALRKYCRTMTVRVRNKQLQTECSAVGKRRRRRHKEGREKEPTNPEVLAGGEFSIRGKPSLLLQACANRQRGQTSLSVTCQGPEVQAVPLQLISMPRLKTLNEHMRRAVEVELHDPPACSVCEREKAHLALRSFISRKTTQLQFQALKGQTKHTLGIWRK